MVPLHRQWAPCEDAAHHALSEQFTPPPNDPATPLVAAQKALPRTLCALEDTQCAPCKSPIAPILQKLPECVSCISPRAALTSNKHTLSDSQPSAVTSRLALHPDNSASLAALCGPIDQHLHDIGGHLGVDIRNRGNLFILNGPEDSVALAEQVLERLYAELRGNVGSLDAESLHLFLREHQNLAPDTAAGKEDYADDENGSEADATDEYAIQTKKKLIRARGANQTAYLRAIARHNICFAIGPAGTGKTYLAVAAAVEALEAGQVDRLVLVRPAVEAGEKLGFLPGGLMQKIDPYLRPLHDALCDMMGASGVHKYMEKGLIEVAPLAYMRGRTLNKAFIILDEAQNTTREQMKMFLTRMGFQSTVVVTGDITQIDLPKGSESGLTHAVKVLSRIRALGFVYFTPSDVVRHKLVQRIVEAYEWHEAQALDPAD